jgi:N-terminal C2 in EEIG1 and EHBP1 proteins
VSIDLNIKSVYIRNLTETLSVQIIWKRGKQRLLILTGAKSIDTKIKTIGPDNPEAVFNEKFQMKTALDWDTLRNKFGKKKSLLAVFTKDKRLLGEADFDLGKYANDPSKSNDQLPLRNCEADPKAFIEIYIKAKMIDVKETATPNAVKTTAKKAASLPAIEEQNSEFEAKEEFERLEAEYLKTINRLEMSLQDINQTLSWKKTSASLLTKAEPQMLPAEDLIRLKNAEIARLESALKEVEDSTEFLADFDDPDTRELGKVDFASIK